MLRTGYARPERLRAAGPTSPRRGGGSLAHAVAPCERRCHVVGLLAKQARGDQLRGRRAGRSASSCSSGASRLATISGAGGSSSRRRSSSAHSTRPRWRRRWRVWRRSTRARGRRALTGEQPSLAAAIASTPEPHAEIEQRAAGGSPAPGPARASSSRHSRVVACAPVPKACPGSMTMSIRPASRGGGAPWRADVEPRRAISTGRWKVRQRDSQSSAISLVRNIDAAPARRSPAALAARQLAGRAVEDVLDRVGVAIELLDAGRARSEQFGERVGGAGAGNPNREADHCWWWRVQRATQTAEDRLVGPQVLVGDRRAQLLEQVALLLAQPARDLHVDDDPQVAAAGGAEAGHAMAAQRDAPRRAACRARLDRDGSSSVGTSSVAPSAASVAGTSSTVIRSSPSRTKRSSSRTRIST